MNYCEKVFPIKSLIHVHLKRLNKGEQTNEQQQHLGKQ